MTWYDIKWNGQEYVEDLTGAAQKTLTVLGIHGYATEAEARAHPQTMNTLQAVTGGAQALSGVSGFGNQSLLRAGLLLEPERLPPRLAALTITSNSPRRLLPGSPTAATSCG